MKRKPVKVSDQLRAAIEVADKSRYQLSKETGIAEAVLSRFMHRKGGLSMEGIDAIAESLELEIVAKRPAKRSTTKGQPKGR